MDKDEMVIINQVLDTKKVPYVPTTIMFLK